MSWRPTYLLLPLGMVLLLSGARVRAEPEKDDKLAEVKKSAVTFVEQLGKGEFEKATKDFDDTMKEKLPVSKVEEIWKGLTDKYGAFKKTGSTRTQKIQKYDIVFVTSEFEKETLEARVVFDSARKIAGLFFKVKEKASADYHPPVYVRRDSFHERDLVINAGGEWPLPATLTVPNGDGPWPTVVLVHGSGPEDRDETVGPNKIFRDLAWGLASSRVAVLRYEKRTKEHGGRLGAALKDKITLKEEVIDDVLAAISLLRKTKEVDARHIFVLGHSLGGMCLPRIGQQDPQVAGLISLAGTTQPLEETVVKQLDYILSLGDLTEAQVKELKEIRDQAAELQKQLASGGPLPAKLPLGFTAAYLIDLHAYKPAEVATQIKQPMLILQGERDYQVTMADFQGWKMALASRANVTFKTYPTLNHLFIEGAGKSKPTEYEKVGHLSGAVIEDIARWIQKQ